MEKLEGSETSCRDGLSQGRGGKGIQRMRESSCPSLIQGEERGVFLKLWRRDK